jgi:hypothetical protein
MEIQGADEELTNTGYVMTALACKAAPPCGLISRVGAVSRHSHDLQFNGDIHPSMTAIQISSGPAGMGSTVSQG